MNNYAIFVRAATGGFRYFCTAFFDCDAGAAHFAQGVFPHCRGIDVWRGRERVLLLLADGDRLH